MDRPLALVVDRDPAARKLVREALDKRGIETLDAGTDTEALAMLRTHPVAVLFAGSSGPAGADLAREATRVRPSVVPILLAPVAPGTVLDALSRGAFDVLDTPLDEERLQAAAHRALRQHAQQRVLAHLGAGSPGAEDGPRLIGRSAAIERVRGQIERLAQSDRAVLLAGESGAGKELAARVLAAQSSRRDRPFVNLDCAASASNPGREDPGSPDTVLSSLEAARGGVLYVDEPTALSLASQERLADRMGHRSEEDARLVLSVARDPDRAVQEGRLHEGLLRAVAGARIDLPPLRSRPEDLLPLAQHFIETVRALNDLGPIHLSPEALAAMERYSWPGNVRELRHAVEQAVILTPDGTIRPDHLPEKVRGHDRGEAARSGRATAAGRFREMKRDVVEAFERAYLQDLLGRHGGNVTAAAQHAGMLRSALQRLLRKYDLRSADYRRGRRHQDAVERP